MSDPVIEKICKRVVEVLATITTGNGFNYTLNVERRKRWEQKPSHLKCIVNQMPPSKENDEVTLKDGWYQQFMLDVFVDIADTPANADSSPDEIHNRVGADIEKVIMENRQWEIDGEHFAIDTTWDGWDEFSTIQGDYAGREYLFTVRYRTETENPYVLG